MKKRGLLCFLLVLCILIIANIASADTLIETGWYRNGDSVVVNKLVLTIYLSETREKVLLSYDSEIKSLKLGTCMIDENLKICLVDFRDGDDLAANIDIYSVKPELSITRTFNATEFFIGDHVEAVVKIKNQGTKEASDVLFEEVFPSGIEIFDSDGTIVNKTSTRWTGDIGIGKEEEIKYEFFATRELDAREKATLTHDSTTYFSKTQNLKAKSCYEYSASFNLTNVTVGSTFDFNFTIENKINKTLEINYVKAYFPDSVDVKGDMSKVGSFWQWSKNISGNSKRDSENSLMPKRSFRLQFPIRIGATCKDIFYEKEYFEEFEVQKPLLVIRTSIDDINQTEFGFHELELDEAYQDDVIFRIQKPTKGLVYSNVNVTVSTDLDFDKGKELNFFLGKLESIDNVKTGEARIIVPLVDSKKIFFMNITASFETQFGEVVVQQKDYEITVQPIRNIRITHEFSKRSIEEGSYQNITVKAENLRETDLKSVRFEDYIVYGDVSEKLKSRTIDIEKGQERSVYEYNIVVPRVSKPTSITIETKVEYSENGKEYSFTKSRTFSAEPKKLDISVEPKIKGDSFTGKAFDIEYIVENNEDEEPAYNIVLHFPLQQDTDVIGLENFTINELS
ncbi:DUF11 domain-containing protein, partial [Candidatus Woesearchaeota archaeon]|nr:DUF11 domain-containing protein [Candidatus Woesearchaeota archaeon]